MATTNGVGPSVQRVMVATDRSETADRAVRWAADLTRSHQAELILLQVLPPALDSTTADATAALRTQAGVSLQRLAEEVAGPRGRGRIVANDDPVQAILDAVEEE